MIKSKRLTSKSGITIPKDLREHTGFFPGMSVDMETVADGAILIKPHVAVCRFCGIPEQIERIRGVDMCHVCREALRKDLNKDGV